MKFAKVMFSQVSVCSQGGLSICPVGVSVQGGFCPGGLCPGGFLSKASLSRVRGVSVWGGGFLSRGVSVQGEPNGQRPLPVR